MRLFLDANVMTYVAFFEGFLVEGTAAELRECREHWVNLQGSEPDQSLRRELEALRILYVLDDQAHFDWLFSDVALGEIIRIQNAIKRQAHEDLLSRLLEHRHDIYTEQKLLWTQCRS